MRRSQRPGDRSPPRDVRAGSQHSDRRRAGRGRELRHRAATPSAWTTSRRRGSARWSRRVRPGGAQRLHRPLAEPAPGLRSDRPGLVPALRTSGLLDRQPRRHAGGAERDGRGRVGRVHPPGLARGRGRKPVVRAERPRTRSTCGWTRRLRRSPSSLRARPTRCAWSVAVDDRLSGLDTGEIEMRRRGGGLVARAGGSPRGQPLVGYVDDERFRSGAYEFRAHARDRAGNEARPTGARTARGPPSTCPRASRPASTSGVRRVMRPERATGRSRLVAPCDGAVTATS